MRKRFHKWYIALLVIGVLFFLPPIYHQFYKFSLFLRGSPETVSLSFKIHDVANSGVKEADQLTAIKLLLKSLDEAIVTYEPVEWIEGVTHNTSSWWTMGEGLIGIGGIALPERRSSVDLKTYDRKAKITHIDLQNLEVEVTFELEPILHYRPRYLELNFSVSPALEELIDYQMNGTTSKMRGFSFGMPINFIIDGKKDFFISQSPHDYWQQGYYFLTNNLLDSLNYSSPTVARPEMIFSLNMTQDTLDNMLLKYSSATIEVTNTQGRDQPQFTEAERYQLAFQDSEDLNSYNLRRDWYILAKPLIKNRSINALPNYFEKGLLLESGNMIDINIYRTQSLTGNSNFLSFDEYWQVYRNQLMRFELISSSKEGWSRQKCWLGAEIKRDNQGELKRYLHFWGMGYQRSTTEVKLNDPDFYEERDLWQGAAKIVEEGDKDQSFIPLESGDDEDCSAKMFKVYNMLLLPEAELMTHLESLKKLILSE
ncbi:hypothetical protein MMG00_03550 [Ignatzschineria rhizosphaerae]|uniref:Uncharacterized protein n=1 Tax=Ignatzschineria rhizosphaerae TaxID=2923279 RepID=A0ABY3X232_9GAMM|nr:hypothetical protein [Ignatzschineria rhizosphaerae]UNM96939.1 hypothetical protein MMG00_03550 [Ignatzschineria rhizosphaerae]